MAGVLQTGIDVLRDRPVRHLEAARHFDFMVGQDLNQEDKRARCNELRDIIEDSKKKILSVMDEINKKDIDYANLIKYLEMMKKNLKIKIIVNLL